MVGRLGHSQIQPNSKIIMANIFNKLFAKPERKSEFLAGAQWAKEADKRVNGLSTKGQNYRILEFLQKGGKITSLEALNLFGCLRLSGRIKDLRDRGYDITTTMVTTSNGKRVAQYSMK